MEKSNSNGIRLKNCLCKMHLVKGCTVQKNTDNLRENACLSVAGQQKQ